MRRRQRGMSAIGILLVLILVVFAALIGMKVTPAYLEYFAIKKAIASITESGEVQGGTARDVRKAFERHQAIDDFQAVRPEDLEITQDGNEMVISFAYEKRIPLFYNISLLINFAGSSNPASLKRPAD